MINQCPECGGQNAMHYTPCPHAPAMPRVSALRTALPKPTAPGKLPYMHGQQATGHEVIFAPNASASWACSSGSISVDGRYKPEPSVRLSTSHEAISGTNGSMGGDLEDDFQPHTGRQNTTRPQIQNLSGTLAAAMEMHEAKYGPIATEYNILLHPDGARIDPSPRLSTCPAKEETLIMKVTNHIGRHPFTHRDKGGRYALTCISKPAGEVMRKVGVTVVYHDIHTRQQYSRDLEDFVRIMVPIPD